MRKILIVLMGTLLTVVPVFSQKNMQFRSNLTYSKRLSDVWGYADSLGNEYALVGVLVREGKLDIHLPAAVFLASRASDYIHGTILPVDGGFLGW